MVAQEQQLQYGRPVAAQGPVLEAPPRCPQ
jgi:hypothetical protein